ncbi:hypothetical protein [Scytonema sp. NUACC21]
MNFTFGISAIANLLVLCCEEKSRKSRILAAEQGLYSMTTTRANIFATLIQQFF